MPHEQDELAACVHEARDKVRRVLDGCGPDACLVGYDVNDIQGYVTANSRPVAMLGASHLIANFDETQRKRADCLFAGGGRGMFLVSAQQAKERVASLPGEFVEATECGVLAAAAVPFTRETQRASLQWLKMRLHVAKDEAAPPSDARPQRKSEQCPRCRLRKATTLVIAGGEEEQVCAACAKVTEAGREEARRRGTLGLSLVELSDRGIVAAVSADGNNMGALFDALETLEAVAAMSVAVARIFKHAHEDALHTAAVDRRKVVAPVTGGDDIRAFFGARHTADYVGALAAGIEGRAAKLGNLDGALSHEAARRAARMGVGVGVVIAADKSSATWMLQRAHDLERSAKRVCAPEGYRSAVDFRWSSVGEAWIDHAPAPHHRSDQRPVSLASDPWNKYLRKVRALGEVPSSQRAVIHERAGQGEAEFNNAFRYQVARSEAWRRWYAETDGDWRDAARVIAHAPDAGMLELLRTMERHG